MNIFSKRPLLVALFLFILTSVIAANTGYRFRIITAAVAFAFSAVILLLAIFQFIRRSAKAKALFNLFLCSAFILGAVLNSASFFNGKLAKIESRDKAENVVLNIRECTYRSSYLAVYTAKVVNIDGQKADFLIEASSSNALELDAGDSIVCDLTFAPFDENNLSYNERKNNISKGIFVSASFEDAEEINYKAPFSLSELFLPLRQYVSKTISRSSYKHSADIIKALLIGDKSEINPETNLNFRRLGVSHILSISGTHFTVLLGMISLVLSCLGLNKKAVYVILIPTAFFYMGLSGFSYSVCRAGIMAIISFWGFLCGKPKDSYTALFFSAAMILLVSPYAVLSIALWLSFVATFIILVVFELFNGQELLKKNNPLIKRFLLLVIMRLAMTVFISFGTLPITALYFGEISLIAPLSNLIIVPLFEFLLYIIPFAVFLPCLTFLASFTDWYVEKVLMLADSICKIDNLLISVRPKFVLIIAVVGIIASLVLISIPLKRKFAILIPSVISILAIFISLSVFYSITEKQSSISFYTSGDSDGVVIVSENNSLCIDITNGSSNSAYTAEYISDSCYCPEISGYLFTHFRARHISMFNKLSSRTNVHSVYLPYTDNKDDLSKINSIIETANEKSIEVIMYAFDTPFKFCGSEVTVFSPKSISRSSHEVIALKITVKGEEILYLGSSFDEAFELDEEIANAEYILFGQHYPVTKKDFDITTNAKLIFSNEALYYHSLNKNQAEIMASDSIYSFAIK